MTLPNPAPNPAACPDKTLQNAVAQAFPTLTQPWTPLQGGRVNAVWRAGDMVIKHYHPSGDSPLFPNDPAAEAAALSLLAPFGLAPKLLGKGQGWIAYHYCPGTAWKTNTARVADTLTRLHQTPFQTAGFRHAPNGSAGDCASPIETATWTRPSEVAACWAAETMAGDTSTPTARPRTPTARAAGSRKAPLPWYFR